MKPTTVEQYLAALPADRRAALIAVRKVILRNLPDGFEEALQYGAISYVVPLSRFPKTYNGQPLALASLASQKSHMAVYLMNIYDEASNRWFAAEYRKSGKKLDMGRACVRFKKLDDLPLDVIGRAIARTGADEFIDKYMKTRPQAARTRKGR